MMTRSQESNEVRYSHACRVSEIQMVVPWIPWDNYLVANNGECLFVGEINKLSIGHRFGI